MTTEIRWERITSGAMFQSLLSGLVLQLDVRARVFSRPGRDGGLDGVSADGSTIYQAKFAASRRLSEIRINDEIAKIVRYRTDPESSGHLRWKAVSRWVLATNVVWGPGDDDTWREAVKPLEATGIQAECWYDEEMADRLRRHPDLLNAFFGSAPRAFLSLPEALEQLRRFEPNERAIDAAFRGRAEAFERFKQFFEEAKPAIAIHGAGGVGKSRLLLELGHWALEQGFVDDVYWALPDVLAGSGEWYSGLVAERRILVLVDEPDDATVIKRLLQEISTSTGRAGQWRMAVAVRTPKDPVLSSLTNPRDRLLAEPFELKPLDATHAEAISRELLISTKPEAVDQAANAVLRAAAGHPMWLSIAALLIESGVPLSDLAIDRWGLAKQYLREAINNFPEQVASREAVRNLLRWLGLLQPLNKEEPDATRFLSQEARVADLDRVLDILIQRRIVTTRGVRQRQIAITPDVIKEHLLLDWLTFVPGSGSTQVTDAGRQLAARLAATESPTVPKTALQHVVHSLGRLQLITGINEVLLAPFVETVSRGAAAAETALQQRVLLTLGSMYSPFNPAQFAQLCELLRSKITPNATYSVPYLGEQSISHDDVVTQLAWPLFNAALGAPTEQQLTIVRELLAITRCENQIFLRRNEEPPNDGQRAKELLARLLVDRTESMHSYRAAAATVANELLEQLSEKSEGELSPIELSLLEGVLKPLLTVERTAHWMPEPGKFSFAQYVIDPAAMEGRLRSSIREALWKLLEAPTYLSARELAIELLVISHREANAAARSNLTVWRAELADDLQRAVSLLQTDRFSKAEAFRARRVWDWHLRFEKEESIAALARSCENALLTCLGPLSELILLDEFQEVKSDRLDALAELKATSSAHDLVSLFAAAAQIEMASGKEAWRFRPVLEFAVYLGKRADRSESIRDLILKGIRAGSKNVIFTAAAACARGWLDARRAVPVPQALGELHQLLSEAVDDESFGALFRELYVAVAPLVTLSYQRGDLEFIIASSKLMQAEPENYCFALGLAFAVDWSLFENAGKTFLLTLADTERKDALRALVRGMHYRQIFTKQAPTGFGAAQAQWLVDRIAEIADPGDLLAFAARDMQLIGSQLSVKTFVQFIERRHEAFSGREGDEASQHRALVFPIAMDVAEIVRPVSNPPSDEERALVVRLFRFVGDEGSLGYALPNIVSDLDPAGSIVPPLVAEELRKLRDSAKTERDLYRWSRFAGWFLEGTDAWRVIALEACKSAHVLGTADAIEVVYSSLTYHRVEVFSGFVGEVPSQFGAAVSRAKELLEKESDPDLRRYWEWVLPREEARLEEQRGLIEERGW